MAARESDAVAAEILSVAWCLKPTLEVQKGTAMTEPTQGNTRAILSIIYRTLKTNLEF